MPISIACPSCRQGLKAPDNAAGRRVKCPKCGTPIQVPEPEPLPLPEPDEAPEPVTPARPSPRSRRANRTALLVAGGGAAVALLLVAVVAAVAMSGAFSKAKTAGTGGTVVKGGSTDSEQVQARALLDAYLESWRAGEKFTDFRGRHPEVGTVLDVKCSASVAAGERLARYEVAGPEPGGTAGIYKYTVILSLDDHGTPKTSVMHYSVYKSPLGDRSKWDIGAN